MQKTKYQTISSISLYFSIFFILLSFISEFLLYFAWSMEAAYPNTSSNNPPIWDFFAFLAQLSCGLTLPLNVILLIANILLRRKNKYLTSGLILLLTIFVNISPYFFAVAMLISGAIFYD